MFVLCIVIGGEVIIMRKILFLIWRYLFISDVDKCENK